VTGSRRIRKSVTLLLALLLLGGGILWLLGFSRRHPEDVPWTKLDLAQPVGAFTGRKLAALAGKGDTCRGLLRRAGIRFVALPRRGADQCGYDDAVRFSARGALSLSYRPDGLATSCPVAAALALWEWHFVQPAALRRFGTKVASVEHYGSYSCRRMYGRTEGAWSEHSSANAVDIAAFRLADGRRISVSDDWKDGGRKALFLHDVRDGACRLFATTLSPDYNQAHHDHLHLDQARRGAMGWRACR
jgi:hypothetical protein